MYGTKFLTPEEFNQDFFDGYLTGNQHPGGYWRYDEAYNDLVWSSIANIILRECPEVQSILEIGCASGKLIKQFTNRDIFALGIEISPYIVGKAEEEIKPHLIMGDIRKDLAQFSDKRFDVVVSHMTLTYLSETDIEKLIPELNRISKKQVHLIQEAPDTRFNISHPIEWWGKLPFENTVLIGEENNSNVAKT